MKKVFVSTLICLMLFALAACASNDTSDTNSTDDPETPGVQGVVVDPAELEENLGITINLPDEYPVTSYSILDDDIANVEFTVGTNKAVGRIAKGQYDDMGLVGNLVFDMDKSEKIAGLTTRLRYTDPEATVVNNALKIGVADAYDKKQDVSYTVVILQNATKEDLTAAMEALIEGSTVQE